MNLPTVLGVWDDRTYKAFQCSHASIWVCNCHPKQKSVNFCPKLYKSLNNIWSKIKFSLKHLHSKFSSLLTSYERIVQNKFSTPQHPIFDIFITFRINWFLFLIIQNQLQTKNSFDLWWFLNSNFISSTFFIQKFENRKIP